MYNFQLECSEKSTVHAFDGETMRIVTHLNQGSSILQFYMGRSLFNWLCQNTLSQFRWSCRWAATCLWPCFLLHTMKVLSGEAKVPTPLFERVVCVVVLIVHINSRVWLMLARYIWTWDYSMENILQYHLYCNCKKHWANFASGYLTGTHMYDSLQQVDFLFAV